MFGEIALETELETIVHPLQCTALTTALHMTAGYMEPARKTPPPATPWKREKVLGKKPYTLTYLLWCWSRHSTKTTNLV